MTHVTYAHLTQGPVERSNFTCLGPTPRNTEDHQYRSDTACDYRNDRTKQRRSQPGFQCTELVRCPDKNIVHRRNAPAHFIRGDELDDRPADDHAHAVERAEKK